MDKRRLVRRTTWVGIPLVIVALAACSSQRAPVDEPAAPPPAGAAEPSAGDVSPEPSAGGTAPAPAVRMPPALAVPRQFDCDPSAVSADTLLTELPTAPDALVLRPSGAACSNHLVFQSGKTERKLSSGPGMIVLASGENVGSSLVVCLSNERHSQNPGGASPLNRHTDGVQLECAARTARGWSPTLVVTPSSAADAAWLVAIRPDPASPDRLTVRWFRDSYFQFLHMVKEGRPATDGIYDTSLTVADGELVVGETVPVAGEWFENQIFAPQPTP